MSSREWTKPIPTGDFVQLRNFCQTTVGHVEDRVMPSKEYLEKKLQELENGEFRAETLAEVVSKDEIDPDVLMPVFDSKGSLTVKKGSTTVPLPTGPEQLRRRLSVMQNCIMMLALKHVSYEEIQDVDKDLFDRYKDYLLGDYVWGLSSTDLQGQQIQTPPWSLVLSYEHAIRKRAYTLMLKEKLKLGAALESAWKCPVTKERLKRLTWTERRKANWGNNLTDFSFEVCKEVQLTDTWLLFENPEDLGALQSGPYAGERPASMWQWPVFSELLQTGRFTTCAFYQQDFGTEYLKPTRLLMKDVADVHEALQMGIPHFDDMGFYQGPLQRRQAPIQLIGHSNGNFCTTGTEQWPSLFCKWVASSLLQHWMNRHTASASGGGQTDTKTSVVDRLDYPTNEPEGWKLRGGDGDPRQCAVPGKTKAFHDGSGLASPGRWDVDKRIWNRDKFWQRLRDRSYDLVLQHCGGQTILDRVCFQMAAKGEAGCDLVKDENLARSLRELWSGMLVEEGYTEDGLLEVAPGQPFRLRLMEALLDRAGRRGVVLAFLYLAVLGFPFKWAKQRGGLKVDWIGLYTDYTTMRLGLSPNRAAWMERWTRQLATSGRVSAKEMEQGLGRLGFAANALTWERPFLGPLYAWTSAIRNKKGLLRIPAMLRTILWFLAERTAEGGSLQEPPPLRKDTTDDVTFFTDAKATDTEAWVGGFLQGATGEILEWYSEEVKEAWAPWLFVRRDPKRVIAALELLATLIAARLWARDMPKGGRGRCWIRAGTDNLSNSYAVSRWMSTKFPLTILIMELSEILRTRSCELNLEWIPRDKNQLADDLTNQKYDQFPKERRVQFVGGDTKWLVLSKLMHKANEFHEELAMERKRKAPEPAGRSRKKQRIIDPW
eukprot:s5030_g1.t1